MCGLAVFILLEVFFFSAKAIKTRLSNNNEMQNIPMCSKNMIQGNEDWSGRNLPVIA
mgnify:CR=1 FL=1